MYRLNYEDTTVVSSKQYGKTNTSKPSVIRPHPRGHDAKTDMIRQRTSVQTDQDSQRKSGASPKVIPGVRQSPSQGYVRDPTTRTFNDKFLSNQGNQSYDSFKPRDNQPMRSYNNY